MSREYDTIEERKLKLQMGTAATTQQLTCVSSFLSDFFFFFFYYLIFVTNTQPNKKKKKEKIKGYITAPAGPKGVPFPSVV